ncbi:MAG: NUDIX hydrolase [Microthrixaceae bacterium]
MAKLAAFATILNDEGAVLLSHRRDLDVWNPPGGGVEAGESPWDAVVRETLEETGLSVRVVGLASTSWKPRRNELLMQFRCEIVGGGLTLTDEADEHRFFPPDQLPPNLSEAFQQRLLAWLDADGTNLLLTDSGPSTRERLAREG